MLHSPIFKQIYICANFPPLFHLARESDVSASAIDTELHMVII